MKSATTLDCLTMTCRFNSLTILIASGALPSPAFAGHAGEMDSPGLMPHELLAGLVGLAGMLLLTILALTWVVWRLRGLERRLRGLEKTQRD
jgi:hypothetical protein